MPPSICVVMAVFRPNPDYLAQQIASLAKQSHVDFSTVFVIADGQSADLVADQAEKAGLRFHLVRPGYALDAVRAFEAGLQEALAIGGPETLFALCDQDDIWHPDRLARGVAALAETGADLVHSDASLIDAAGKPLHASMFAFEKRQRRPGLRGLLYRNNITGMTVLMRRRVVEIALPFPQQSGVHFYHDLWLGLIANCLGGVHLIRDPLVDYRQHGENAIGAVDRRGAKGGAKLRLPSMTWLRRESAGYGLARYLAQSTFHRMNESVSLGELPRGEARLSPLKPFLRRVRGPGTHFLDAGRLLLTGHPRLARIATGFGIVGLGRMVWSLRQALGPGLRDTVDRFDARLYSLSPGVVPASLAAGADNPGKIAPSHTGIIDKRKRARWRPEFSAESPAVTVLVPTLNPTEIFAGIVTALDIGLGLAAEGHAVRFVATDLPMSSAAASRRFLLQRLPRQENDEDTAARITLHCGVTEETLPAHPSDIFLATAWWTAHAADGLIREHGFKNPRFLYLIQDFEPNFYPWGPEYADAWASYEFDFTPIFNTTLLRDYFAAQGFGFATADSAAFQPAIDIARYASGQRAGRAGPRRLALYGRPEVPRNMFPTAIEALARFIEAEGLGPRDIEMISIGLSHTPVSLPNGTMLRSLGKLPWEDYPNYLLGVDLGLSLMYSPHPSHPPIEMAASGARVVTNRFATKDLSRLSPAILSTGADAPALAAALSQAWAMGPVSDAERRIDLDQLGQTLRDMTLGLARDLHTQFRTKG